jgi:3-methyl-2-oxobutanoate hydroxymethyltransferase
MKEARALQEAGCFCIVLEMVQEEIATRITKELLIPTIGIGAGKNTDGQVLVINDLLKMGPKTPPKFCPPIADFYQMKKELIIKYLQDQRK